MEQRQWPTYQSCVGLCNVGMGSELIPLWVLMKRNLTTKKQRGRECNRVWMGFELDSTKWDK